MDRVCCGFGVARVGGYSACDEYANATSIAQVAPQAAPTEVIANREVAGSSSMSADEKSEEAHSVQIAEATKEQGVAGSPVTDSPVTDSPNEQADEVRAGAVDESIERNPEQQTHADVVAQERPTETNDVKATEATPKTIQNRVRRPVRTRNALVDSSKSASNEAISKNGKVNVLAIPAGKVFIDGKFAGNTPLIGFAASSGSHKVRVDTENGSKTVTVFVKPNEVARATITISGGS
ncbi:MAG: hypothetical protein R3A47_09500 [Polyangiales bacterium]